MIALSVCCSECVYVSNLLITQLLRGVRRLDKLITPGKVAVVTPNDRPKLVQNRSVVEPFDTVFVLLCLIENVLLAS